MYGVSKYYVRNWKKKIKQIDSGETVYMEGDMLEDFKRVVYHEDIHSIYDTPNGRGKHIKLKTCSLLLKEEI
jgi:hypothetical protein